MAGYRLILGVKQSYHYVHWLGCDLTKFVAYCYIQLQCCALGYTVEKIPGVLGVYHLNCGLIAVLDKCRFKAVVV